MKLTIKSTPKTAKPSACPAASTKLLYFVVFQCTKCSSPEKERPSTVCSEPWPFTAPQWQCHCSSLYTSLPRGPPRSTVRKQENKIKIQLIGSYFVTCAQVIIPRQKSLKKPLCLHKSL